MTTFKEFINEGKFISSLKYDEKVDILKILKNRCSEFLKSSKEPIYRGFKHSSSPWFISQPSKYERKSKLGASGNVYTVLMDNLNSWQKFPKRSRSLICSTSGSTAKNYGQVYLVIPFDGAKWGVCPDEDIWNSFDNTLEDVFDTRSLQDFNPKFSDLFDSLDKLFPEKLNKYDGVIDTSDFKFLLSALKAMDSCLEELQQKPQEYEKNNPDIIRKYGPIKHWDEYTLSNVYHFIQLRKKYGNLGNILAYALNPDKNRFKIATNKDVSKIAGSDREVWTSSDCVIINPDKFTDVYIEPLLKKEAEQIVMSNKKKISEDEKDEMIDDKYEELIEKYKLYDDIYDSYQFIRKLILK